MAHQLYTPEEIKQALKTWPKDKPFGIACEDIKGGEIGPVELSKEFEEHLIGTLKDFCTVIKEPNGDFRIVGRAKLLGRETR